MYSFKELGEVLGKGTLYIYLNARVSYFKEGGPYSVKNAPNLLLIIPRDVSFCFVDDMMEITTFGGATIKVSTLDFSSRRLDESGYIDIREELVTSKALRVKFDEIHLILGELFEEVQLLNRTI